MQVKWEVEIENLGLITKVNYRKLGIKVNNFDYKLTNSGGESVY